MANLVASLRFSEEFEGSDVLTTIDPYRLCLKGNNNVFSLSFSSLFSEKLESHDIAITNRLKKNPFHDAGENENNAEEDFEKVLKGFNHRGFISISTCNLSPHRNVYSVLQGSGDLMILVDGVKEWQLLHHYLELHMNESTKASFNFSCIDITSQSSTLQHLDNTHQQQLLNTQQQQRLKENFLSQPVSVNGHTWLKGDGGCSYLAVSHMGGVVALWKCQAHMQKCALECIVNTALRGFNRMHMFHNTTNQTCLCLASMHGEVLLVTWEGSDETTLKFLSCRHLWQEKDLINVDNILYHPQTDRILLTKINNILCFANISKHPHPPTIIKVPCKYHISSILPTNIDYLITTYDGSAYTLTFHDDGRHSVQTYALEWSSSEWHIASACLSYCKCFFVCAVTPSQSFCNRKFKQPYLVNYTRLKSAEKACNEVLSYLGLPLFHLYDLLSAAKTESSLSALWGVVGEEEEVWREVDLTQAKALRFLLFVISLKCKDSDAKKEEVEKKKRRIERSILHKHFTTLLQSLNVTKARLTAKESQSLALIKSFLSPTEDAQDVPKEACPACACDIATTSYESVLCVNGHFFPRCSQTLLIVEQLQCRACKQCAKPACRVNNKDKDLFKELQTDCCPFCDGFLSL